MSPRAVSKGRAQVSSGFGPLQITIPSRKNWFVILFLLLWIGGWYFGAVSAISSLTRPGADTEWFLVFWLLAWTVGGAFAAVSWLWNVAGREVLHFDGGLLTYQRAIGPVKFTRSYDLGHVKDLRVTPLPGIMQREQLRGLGFTGGPITFDYGASTINLGAGVDEAEARSLVETIKHRCNI